MKANEVLSILGITSMKLYSSRRKKKLDLVNKDLKLEQEITEE